MNYFRAVEADYHISMYSNNDFYYSISNYSRWSKCTDIMIEYSGTVYRGDNAISAKGRWTKAEIFQNYRGAAFTDGMGFAGHVEHPFNRAIFLHFPASYVLLYFNLLAPIFQPYRFCPSIPGISWSRSRQTRWMKIEGDKMVETRVEFSDSSRESRVVSSAKWS